MSEKASQALPATFARTTDEIISLEEWNRLLGSGRKLRVKYGVDVTAPELHLGHAVNLFMLRTLQDLGHKVVFLIGDFTTQIGDPTGRNSVRPVISKEDIEKNIVKFIDQAKMVLRFDNPELLEVRRNSEWFDKMPMGEFMQLLSLVTQNHLMSRDMFQRRVAEGIDIHVHELLYPVLQGFDSVMLEADLTIIGSDQLFNEMLGRELQRKHRQHPQVIITSKITPGLDGKQKQSKSIGNFVGLSHSPRDKFGRVMTLPDQLIHLWFEVYTTVSEDELREISALVITDPFEAKKRLATAIVERFHGAQEALSERQWFEQTFSKRETPENISEITLNGNAQTVLHVLQIFFGNGKSTSDLHRLIKQGAVRLNGEKCFVSDQVVDQDGMVIQAGKRTWFKVRT